MQLPTINKKFLLKFVVVLAVLAGALFGTHALQARRIPEALKSQAERAEEAAATDPKKADSAISYLRQYLEFSPTDVNAQEKLAVMLRARAKRTGKAPSDLLMLYDRILLADPSRMETRREAIKASIAIGRYTDAETHCLALIKQLPNDAAVWVDLAYAQRGLQKMTDARSSYDKAIQLEPTKSEAYQELADFLYNEMRNKDEARVVLDQLVKAIPDAAKSYTIRARFNSALGQDAAALADAKKAIALEADNGEAMLLMGEQLQKSRESVQAAADLFKQGMSKYPQDVRFVRQLAWLEVSRSNNGAAVTVLENGLANVSEKDRFDLLVPLADMLLTMRDPEKPRQLITKLQSRTSTDPVEQRTIAMQSLYLVGRLAMSENRWSDAIRDLEKLRADCGELVGLECQTNLLLSYCYQRTGEPEQEEKVLRLLLSRDPNHLAGRRALGDLCLNTGRFDESIAEYEIAAKSRYSTADCRAKLLKMKASRYRNTGASKAAWAELDAQLEAFRPSFGDSTSEFGLLRAELLKTRGQLDRALAILRNEANKRPTDAKVWSIYANTAADFAGVSPALSILDEAQAACGDKLELRLARATLSARDPSGLRPIEPLSAQIDLWPESEQSQLLFGLVEVFDRLNDEANVQKTYRRIAGRYPSERAVWEGLFDRSTRSGDVATANEARAMILKLDPKSAETATLLRGLEVANAKRTAESSAAIAGMVEEFTSTPNRSDICVVLGRLYLLHGDTAKAGECFQRGARIDPLRFGLTQEYLQFLAVTGNEAVLQRLMTRLAQDFRWSGEPLRRAIRQTVARIDAVAAKRLIDLAKPHVERDPDGTGWLGDCYKAAGFENDAMVHFANAVTLPTSTADDWLRLAIRQTEAKNEIAAIETMKLAKTKLNSPQLYYMTAAQFADTPLSPKNWLPELPTISEKKMFSQARLSLKLSRFQKDEAVVVLEDFIRENGASTKDCVWARRQLAMMLAARGTTQDRSRAKELLTGEDATIGDTADEKRSTAAVLAGLSRQLEGSDRDQVLNRAVTVLADVVRETKNPRDKFLLSQLYRTSASWMPDETAKNHRRLGRTLLQELIRDDRTNIEYYVAALEEATEPADQQVAQNCADYLIKNFPTDYRVVQAVARHAVRTGQGEKALDILVAYSKTADATPGDYQARCSRTAELLDELIRKPGIKGTDLASRMTNFAIEKYDVLYEFRPDAIVAVAGMLSNDNRPAEAFAKIEKHAKLLPARVRVLAGLAILRSGSREAKSVDKVRTWLDSSRNEEPNSVAVLLNEGEFHSLTKDFDAAEKAYQAVLKIDDQNVVALNNLAWLLAANPEASDRAMDLVEKATRLIGLTGELLDTRARIRISKKQYTEAMQDLQAALKQEQTALRLFHLALATSMKAADSPEAGKDYFAQAKKRGLRMSQVHPADEAIYQQFDAMK
jgi:predicted Zn-dependent protease/lipopolysaccharide biosynthesis regulator YciM